MVATVPERLARPAAVGGILAVVSGVALVAVMEADAALSGMNLARRTISHHALAVNGWVFDLSVVLLAAGSLGVVASLVTTGIFRLGSAESMAFGLWSAGLIMTAVFTKHDWSVGPSLSGYVHWAGTLIAFLSLPVAVILLGRRHLAEPRWRGRARMSLVLGVLSLLWFLPIVAAVGVHLTAGTPWWRVVPLGLVERLLAGTELLALLAVALWALAASTRRTGEPADRGDGVLEAPS